MDIRRQTSLISPSVTSFSNVFLTGGASRLQVTSSKNRKFGPPWLGRRSLSCRFCASQGNCVGLRGDWQLVTLTRLFLSSKNKKKKDVNEPLISLYFLKSYELKTLILRERN